MFVYTILFEEFFIDKKKSIKNPYIIHKKLQSSAVKVEIIFWQY